MNKNVRKGSLLLLLGAVIWGCAFVAQNVGMNHLGPLTFNGVRSFIGVLTLLPFVLIRASRERREHPERTPQQWRDARKKRITASVVSGIALFAATTLQQMGLVYTSPGKAGFITAMYIVTVPVAYVFMGKRADMRIWASVAISVVGLYLLCVTEQLNIGRGDAYTIISALFWTLQILAVDRYAPQVDCVALVMGGFTVVGLLSIVPALLTEQVTMQALLACAVPLLYTGVLSSGLAYTLQAIGQKYTPPTIAAILMSMESVFAVLAGFVLLNSRLSMRELSGCALMFAAVILAQLPGSGVKGKKELRCAERKLNRNIA